MMPSSPDPEPLDAESVSARLAPGRVAEVARREGGGNSRIYCVGLADGRRFALKGYPSPERDPRDRLGTEWAALSFLAEQGIGQVPRPIAMDRPSSFGLYQWIDGEPVATVGAAEIDEALGFLRCLHGLRGAAGADRLPPASEPCFSAAEVVAQLDRRHARLSEVAQDDAQLRGFLEDEFLPVRSAVEREARQAYDRLGWTIAAPIAAAARTLSPADFGFHNTLRRPDGSLAFLDFEYFGWDDPVKLVADVIQHPAMSLGDAGRQRFRAGAIEVYGDDPAFADRLHILYPLFGLRWCMVMLNEFLPERWKARLFAGVRTDQEEARKNQLRKARDCLAALGSA